MLSILIDLYYGASRGFNCILWGICVFYTLLDPFSLPCVWLTSIFPFYPFPVSLWLHSHSFTLGSLLIPLFVSTSPSDLNLLLSLIYFQARLFLSAFPGLIFCTLVLWFCFRTGFFSLFHSSWLCLFSHIHSHIPHSCYRLFVFKYSLWCSLSLPAAIPINCEHAIAPWLWSINYRSPADLKFKFNGQFSMFILSNLSFLFGHL